MRPYARSCALVFAALVFVISADFNRTLAQTPTPTPSPVQAGQVIISELRLRGPAGAEDEFIELYNNTDSPIIVQSLDGSGGWTVAISNGQITGPIFTVPNGTTIPARGHLLGANANGYSLCNYPSGNGTITPTAAATEAPAAAAAPCVLNGVSGSFTHTIPDRTWDFDVPDGSGVALFATTNGTNFNAGTRLDAAGFTISPALYREGNGIPSLVTANTEHTYYRDLRSGTPRDTGDNSADFLLVGTAPNIQITRLGAPGPENLASPIVNNTTIVGTLLDSGVASVAAPNRSRTFTQEANATFGTLLIRRTITNNTGAPVSRLRFRVINITTFGTPGAECGGTCSDVRALTSQDETITLSNQQSVQVRGLRLEEPPEQPAGGGYNSSLSADFITLATPLAAGQSVNIVFKLGIERTGPFRFFVNIEALNTAPAPINGPDFSGVSATGATDVKSRRLIVSTDQSAPEATGAPPTPAAAPPSAAGPRGVYIPWFINTSPPASKSTRAAKDKAGADDEDKEKESKEALPSEQPAPQTPETSPPASPAATADDSAPQSIPATTRRDSSKKPPATAKATRRGGKK